MRKVATPGSSLRTYLESRNDRPLDQVLTFVRYFLKEKDASELLQEMTNKLRVKTPKLSS